MANQNAEIKVRPARGGAPFGIRLTVVDTDGNNSTFDDRAGGSVYTAETDLEILDVKGRGTTAPAAITSLQANVNGTDRLKFADIAAMYDADSGAADRAGSLLGGIITQGSALQLIGRA